MTSAVRRRRASTPDDDSGFTLIELLVVLLIIGILLAIAIPTFLSVTKGANNTAAQSNLQTALTGLNTFYTQNDESFSGLDGGASGASSLTQIDTGLSYVFYGPSTSSKIISVAYDDPGDSAITAFAAGTNDCWGILDLKQGYAQYGGSVMGETHVGTYYFVLRNTTTSQCQYDSLGLDTNGNPSNFAISQSKFPNG